MNTIQPTKNFLSLISKISQYSGRGQIRQEKTIRQREIGVEISTKCIVGEICLVTKMGYQVVQGYHAGYERSGPNL